MEDSLLKLQIEIFKNLEQSINLITKQKLRRHVTNLLREKINQLLIQLGIKFPQYQILGGFKNLLNQINESSRKLFDGVNNLIKTRFFQDFNFKGQNISNLFIFIDFDSNLKNIQININNFSVQNKMDQSSLFELEDFSINISENLLIKLDNLLDECSQKIAKNKATSLSNKLTSELSFIVWLSYDKMIQIEAPATHEFFYSLKLIHKQLEKQDLDIIQQKKIISVIDKANNKYISPDMINNFFNYTWVNKEDREYMLNSEEQIEEIQYQPGILQMQCVAAKQGHQLLNRKYFIEQDGLIEEGNKNGVVRVGRSSNIYTNEVSIEGDMSISRKQFQIIFKGKYGYCAVDTSNSNLTGILINKDGFQLYNNAVINVGNFSNVYLEVIEFNNGSFDVQNQILSSSQIIQQKNINDEEEEDSKTIIFKKVRPKPKQEEVLVQPLIKQNSQKDVLKLLSDEDDGESDTFSPFKQRQKSNMMEEKKQDDSDEEKQERTLNVVKKRPPQKQNVHEQQDVIKNKKEEEVEEGLTYFSKKPRPQQKQNIQEQKDMIKNKEEDEKDGQTLAPKKMRPPQLVQQHKKDESDEEKQEKTLNVVKKRPFNQQNVQRINVDLGLDDDDQSDQTMNQSDAQKRSQNQQKVEQINVDIDDDKSNKTMNQSDLKKIKEQQQLQQESQQSSQTGDQTQVARVSKDITQQKNLSQSLNSSILADNWNDNNLQENLKQLKIKPFIKLKIHNYSLENTIVEYSKNVDFIESNGEEITIGGKINNSVFFTNSKEHLPDKLFVICYEKWQWKIKKIDSSFVSVINLKNMKETEQKVPSKAFPIQKDMILSIGSLGEEFQFKFKFNNCD